ncbi:metallophosphoesterase family protein [Paenibacillus sp. MBLB4367]|uniref:metallophosphoesterase family protein n=1 Tax=Paenibacillus sp. MBLB4367 TaxID=3384767 RepID=UPI003907E89F
MTNRTGKPLRFGIFADLHQDIMHDAPERLQAFIERMERERVDFIIQLGDLCLPKPENETILRIWNGFTGPKYHVIGNHDTDISTREAFMAFIGMERNYYSFDAGDYHFVVLDANFFRAEDGRMLAFERGNYSPYYAVPQSIPFVTDEQLDWLRRDLSATEKQTIIFSHQGLLNEEDGIVNRTDMHNLLTAANEEAGFGKVAACMNGHNHVDNVTTVDGIHYVEVNSISNQWLGDSYACVRYSEAISNAHPNLKYVVPYRDPLYAIVTLMPNGMQIEGADSEFAGPGPKELGHSGMVSGHPITPAISSRLLSI